jgi:hypothetical protein
VRKRQADGMNHTQDRNKAHYRMFSEISFNLHWVVICANVCKGRSGGFRQLAACCDVIVNCIISGWGV